MKTGISRRQFLAATGAIFAIPALSAIESAAQLQETATSGRLALLLPSPKAYPQLGKEINAGLASVLPANQRLNHISINELNNLQGVDTLITYASPSSAALLRNRLGESPVQIVAADLGMDVERFREKLPRLNYFSLNFWQASQALALWTSENLGSNIALVTDSYESGYDSFSVFQSVFPQAEVLLYKKDESLAALRRGGYDAVAFALHGKAAQSFVRAYERSGISSSLVRLPYVGNAISATVPTYSAELALDSAPFFALGEMIGLALQGQQKIQNTILIKGQSQTIAEFSQASLPYHGLQTAFKTGWTNPYLSY